MKLELYSGKDCHLCNLALDLVNSVKQEVEFELVTLDIKDNHALYHLYALRIPVLKRLDSEKELGWPFDIEQLREFIR